MTTNDELKPGTPLPWEVGTIQSEGEYGGGPDTVAGFAVSAIYDAQGNVLFDALNSDVIEVHEDYADEDGFCSAWDATSAANAAYIVHACNAYPALTAERDRLVREVTAMRQYIANQANQINIVGSNFDRVQTALDDFVRDLQARCPPRTHPRSRMMDDKRPSITATCSTCRHRKADPRPEYQRDGWCWRYPPVLVETVAFDGSGANHFSQQRPWMRGDDWCGEWSAL